MGGIETSRKIKQHAESEHIPRIIMATSYGRQEVMQQAEEVGLDGFLIKPVNPSLMFNTIMEVFGKEIDRKPRSQTFQETDKDTLKKIRGARILLAEDNEINQQVATEILMGAGLQVSLANNGQEAVEALKKHDFDAVLMDIQMPVLDGYKATRRIRKWEEELKAQSSKLKAKDRGQRAEGRKQRTKLKPTASNLQPATSQSSP
jgi:CheY-like chemotaxis protein